MQKLFLYGCSTIVKVSDLFHGKFELIVNELVIYLWCLLTVQLDCFGVPWSFAFFMSFKKCVVTLCHRYLK